MSARNSFKVFGPFNFRLHKGTKTLDADATEAAIKAQIEREYPKDNLDIKGGCYVFAIRRSGGGMKGGTFMPWYVGKAVRSSLLKESLDSDKYKKCYVDIAVTMHGTPVLFWIAKAAPGQKNSLDKSAIGKMDKKLIETAALRNPNLLNKHHNKPLPFEIDGVPLGGQSHPRAKKGAAAWMWRMLRQD